MEIADAQKVICQYLRTVTTVTVGGKVPTTRTLDSGPLVVVRRSGGTFSRPIRDKAQVDILVWHTSEALAMELANSLRSFMWFSMSGQVIDGHTIYKPSEVSGPQFYPDPAGATVPIVMFSMEIPIRVK